MVVGYFWPGCDGIIYYSSAKQNVTARDAPGLKSLKTKLKDTLTQIRSKATFLDVIAHSMGNRLMLEALSDEMTLSTPTVRNFYSFAAAVQVHEIEAGQIYETAIKRCETLYVFHSDVDVAVRLCGKVEHEMSLGAEVGIELSRVPSNMQFLDCTQFLKGDHSAYFEPVATPIYNFIHNQQVHALMTPPPKEWILLEDGSITEGDVVLTWAQSAEFVTQALGDRIGLPSAVTSSMAHAISSATAEMEAAGLIHDD